MFALEIEFHDGISSPETVLIRRASSVIGSGEQAHVVIEGIPSAAGELRVVRGIGREFRCQPVRRMGQEAKPHFLEGSYRGSTELKLGDVTLRLTALDLDLCYVPEEAPDKAALRVLQRALGKPSPVFPAVAVHGVQPVMLSFADDLSLLVGRSRKCGLRLDASDVSGEHARLGLDDGRMWIEDLGSTNGTYVDGQRVSGRRHLKHREVVQIGSEFLISPILSAQDVADVSGNRQNAPAEAPAENVSYPCLISPSEAIKPERLAFGTKREISIGRDPANDIWINAPHISRQHVTVFWMPPGSISVVDHSSNGTYLWGERLPKEQPFVIEDDLAVLDFCSGITAAICRTADAEKNFFNKSVAPATTQTQVEQFKEEEPGLSAYRGAQGGAKLSSWDDFVESNDRDQPRQQSVFEKLVERHGNPAQSEEIIASDNSPSEEPPFDAGEFVDEHNEPPPAEPMNQETMMFPKLSGVLDEDGVDSGSRISDLGISEAKRREAEELFLSEEYEDAEFEAQPGRGILRLVLFALVMLMAGFCLLLVFGFFSENYFY